MADDDSAVREKLALLEAEVKADADAQRARKEAALAKVREQRAAQQAERQELRDRQAALVRKRPQTSELRRASEDDPNDLGGAIELAGKANRVRQELQKKPAKGEKSWIKSGLASTAFGPLGWLYAGSWREAVPASAGFLLLLTVASKILPMFLLMWAMFLVMPISGIAGVVYALQYNRHGGRQRLFDKDDDKKQLPGR